MAFPFYRSYLTFVRKNGLRPSQDPPTTVGTRQLCSDGVVQVTNYEAIIYSSRRVIQDLPECSQ